MPENNCSIPDLENYRDVLYFAAQFDLDPQLQGKLDLSGVVQQTLWDAHAGFTEFRGTREHELLAWLRRILANNLIDEIRKLDRAKYDARLEVSLAESSLRLEAVLATDYTPPSHRAVRNEEMFRLMQAMLDLPEDQRTAVLRHHLQGATLALVAIEMDRSKEAVAGLIHRGMTRLRDLLAECGSCGTGGYELRHRR